MYTGRRQRCARCQRPATHCLCAHIPSLPNRTRVLVLQHSDEARHPLNTARLAVLGLQHADLWVGEHFEQLEEIVAAAVQPLLLFPASKENAGSEQTNSPDVPAVALDSSLLIVPDGTWRKARQIVRANPVLQELPRLSLPAGQPSEYRIRKATEPAALATIEAIVRALETLEPQQDFQPLLRPFRVMVEQQIRAMGEGVYQRTHGV